LNALRATTSGGMCPLPLLGAWGRCSWRAIFQSVWPRHPWEDHDVIPIRAVAVMRRARITEIGIRRRYSASRGFSITPPAEAEIALASLLIGSAPGSVAGGGSAGAGLWRMKRGFGFGFGKAAWRAACWARASATADFRRASNRSGIYDFVVTPEREKKIASEFWAHPSEVSHRHRLGKGRAAVSNLEKLRRTLSAGGCWGVGIAGDGNQRSNALAGHLAG
jgi:hypothetical protein